MTDDTYEAIATERVKVPVVWHKEILGDNVRIEIRWAEEVPERRATAAIYRYKEIKRCDVSRCAGRAEGKLDGTNLCMRHMNEYRARYL